MITELYTDRLCLRQMQAADSSSLLTIWSDPDVTRFMNISPFTSEEQVVAMITYLDELAQTNQAIRYTMVDLESREVIGSCGYNELDFEHGKVEIGYDIAKPCWGRGYAVEAVSCLVEHAFRELNLHRIEARVEPANLNSIKVLQKLHFTYEGTLRQCERSKGSFNDLQMYSRLSTDV
ncbi:GNAT family N-acetyltransferase [Paenibacillus sp. ACRRX]|uniref:GNAT family N-acetyltransferase n=1 Tax=unclassified Paenibacillus TaxID=185978 RepID=UPI001EF73C1C|nr:MULTISPECIES: GNAT family N-acetyltransferase [unclassified Paenibacillus]MCG7409063.1 GNAT family N-acetyltransferase [Paenibacillus sp. ACRRX]MDK8181937.1 GNAT family N-acetyltransferase [Paenibacillus sp. UMB4589-SE434]